MDAAEGKKGRHVKRIVVDKESRDRGRRLFGILQRGASGRLGGAAVPNEHVATGSGGESISHEMTNAPLPPSSTSAAKFLQIADKLAAERKALGELVEAEQEAKREAREAHRAVLRAERDARELEAARARAGLAEQHAEIRDRFRLTRTEPQLYWCTAPLPEA